MEYLIWGIALLGTLTLGFYFGFQNGKFDDAQKIRQLRELLKSQVEANDKIKEVIAAASKQRHLQRKHVITSLDLDW
jgi:hypothetical protein